MCRQCGSALPSGRPGKLYCSPACCDRWRYLNKVKPAKHGEQSCAECGVGFVRSGQHRKYCSRGCAERVHQRRNTPDGYQSQRVFGMGTCAVCSTEFVRMNSRAKYCSRICGVEATHVKRMANGAYEVQRERIRRPEYGTPCVDCGVPLKRFRADLPRCKSCGIAAKGRRLRVARRRRLAAERLATAATGTVGRFPFASGRCLSCGTWFLHHQLGGPSTCYCSRSCRGKSARGRGARRRQISKLARTRVHDRCNWLCQICGDPVNRDAAIGEPDYPVIDHRLPLAAGGADDESNWQTAHWYCNSVKRDQVGFEFWTPEEVAA